MISFPPFRHLRFRQESFWHRCFIMGTFRHVHHSALQTRRSGRWTFPHGNVSTWGLFSTRNFGHSSTGAEMSLPKHPYCFARCQNIHGPKCSGTKISRAEMSMVPKILCAKNSPCQKVAMSKGSRVETSICRNVRRAKGCTCRMVSMIKHPCRNDWPKSSVRKWWVGQGRTEWRNC